MPAQLAEHDMSLVARYKRIQCLNSRLLHDRTGSAYVLAATTLLVGVTLALAMLRSVDAGLSGEIRADQKQAAANMAEAGIEYAVWQTQYQSAPVPYDAEVSLSTGSFHVHVDDGSLEPGMLLITSVGEYKGCSYTMKRAIGTNSMPIPYNYAWCENGDLMVDGNITATQSPGGLRANGCIVISNPLTNIETGVWAVGTIDVTDGMAQPRYESSSTVDFYGVDYAYYTMMSTNVYEGDVTITSLNNVDGYALIVVNGNVTISGSYTGVYTVVANGSITVDGDLASGCEGSSLALITDQMVTVTNAASSVHAIIYCHNWDNTGTIDIQGDTAFTGCLAADDIAMTGAVSVARDPAWSMESLRELVLPGL